MKQLQKNLGKCSGIMCTALYDLPVLHYHSERLNQVTSYFRFHSVSSLFLQHAATTVSVKHLQWQ